MHLLVRDQQSNCTTDSYHGVFHSLLCGGIRTLKKGMIKWKASSGRPMSKSEDNTPPEEQAAVELVESEEGKEPKEAKVERFKSLDLDESVPAELRAIYSEETTLHPWSKFGLTFLIWTIVLVFALLRGGRGGDSIVGASCGGALWSVLFVVNLVILLLFTMWLRKLTMTLFEKKLELGHKLLEGDLTWTKKSTIQYPALCIFAGIAAGLLGIGGGMVTPRLSSLPRFLFSCRTSSSLSHVHSPAHSHSGLPL